MVLSATSPSPSSGPPSGPSTVSSHLDHIAAELAQDPNLMRIKKLLVYVCTGIWEINPYRLERSSLRSLLQQLFEGSPSLEALQQRLNQVVSTLNKSAEYTIIANAIISRFPALYAELQHTEPDPANQALYQQIVQSLAAEPRHTRMKKLLLLTCRSRWENNPATLEQIGFEQLVPEIHQIAPTLESLRATLVQVAQALSKPSEYIEIAHRIAIVFQPLYAQLASEQSTVWFGQPQSSSQRSEAWSAIPAAPSAPAIASSPNSDLPPGNLRDPNSMMTMPEGQEIAAAQSATESATMPELATEPELATSAEIPLAVDSPPSPAKPLLQVVTIAQPHKITDLFNLRLEIMQDTNPLKAKILLFSVLHEPFRWDAEHDALLKSHELDDLLRILFISHRLYLDVAQKLRQAAKDLSGDYSQTAEAVLRAIQSCYTEMSIPVAPVLVPATSAPLTEITSMKAETHEITQPDRQSWINHVERI